MTALALEVTDTTLVARQSLGASQEYKAFARWLRRLGIWTDGHHPGAMPAYTAEQAKTFEYALPVWVPLDREIVRDVDGRRVWYPYFLDAVHDLEPVVGYGWVQLEGAPPPWPDEIARHVAPE